MYREHCQQGRLPWLVLYETRILAVGYVNFPTALGIAPERAFAELGERMAKRDMMPGWHRQRWLDEAKPQGRIRHNAFELRDLGSLDTTHTFGKATQAVLAAASI